MDSVTLPTLEGPRAIREDVGALVRVVAQPSLFRQPTARQAVEVPYGATLLDLLLLTGMGQLDGSTVTLPGRVVITIDGDPVERAFWHCVRPRAGRLVNIFVMPQDSRTAIYVGVALAITAAAILTGGAAAGLLGPTAAAGGATGGLGLLGFGGAAIAGGVVTAGIAVAGQYALSRFLPMEADQEGVNGPSPARSVTGQANRLEQNVFVPIVLGEMRMFPHNYARPFTEKAGSDTYLRMLLCVGQGPLAVDQLKVGDTAIGDLGADIEVEIREGRLSDDPLTLFTNKNIVTEVNPSSTQGEIRRGGDANPISWIQTTADDTEEITVDLKWPGGIVANRATGKRDPYSVEYDLALRLADQDPEDDWQDFENGSSTLQKHQEEHETSNLIYRTHRRKNLDPGTYDVRLRRRTGDNDPGDTNIGNFFWTALRSLRGGDPRPDKTLACIALRVKRSASTSVPVISCRARSYVQDWNGVTWTEAISSNPASLGRHLLQGPGINPNPLSDSGMDLPSWQDFHDHCDDEGFTFNGVFDDAAQARERVHIVLAAGRGRLIPPETKYAVAIDRNGKSITGMITPRNSWGFRGSHILRPELHALRVLFLNADEDYQLDERVVYADGYNAGTAEDGHIEILDLTKSGIVTSDLAWRHGRYRLADYALRLDVYRVNQGYESLQAVPGDLVAFEHPVPLLGLGQARIKSVTTDMSGDVTGVTIDDAVTMEGGEDYAATVRLIDDAGADQFLTRTVTTVAGTTKTLAFETPFDAAAAPAVGDLLVFGLATLPVVKCLVKDILPGTKNSAEIVLVDEAPGVNDADTGEIPEYTSQITLPGDFFGTPPAVPVIDEIRVENIAHPSQPDVVTTQQIVVHLVAVGTAEQPPTGYEAEIKRIDQTSYQRRYLFPPDTAELTIPVVQSDAIYDVRVRATGRSPAGIPNVSDWSSVVQISVPLPQRTLAKTARVSGLELFEQGDNTVFTGPDAHLTWRLTATHGAATVGGDTNSLNAFFDPAFSFYEVEVIDPATSFVRRIERIGVPEFIYTFAKNKEDSIRQDAQQGGGTTRPKRRFTVRVTFVDTFSQRGPGQTLTVENPAPPAPEGLLISGAAQALLVKANRPDDGDFEKMKVYVSTQSGFDPNAPSTQVVEVESNIVTITAGLPAATGTTLFVRVAMADRFSDQHTDLNLSSEVAVVIEAPEGPPQFNMTSMKFTAKARDNVVVWTSGTMHILDGATVTQEPVAAGQATWTSGVLWLYYVRGTGVVQATTNAALAQQPDRAVLAQYFGKNRLTKAGGLFPVTNSVSAKGDDFEIARNTWVTVLTAESVETAGNPVTIIAALDISGAAQDTDDPGGGDMQSRARILRDGDSIRTFTLASDSAGSGGVRLTVNVPDPRTILWVDENAQAGLHSYAIQMRVDADHVADFDAVARCSALTIYETML